MNLVWGGDEKRKIKMTSILNKWCLKGNGTPLQYSCLENPMNGGAW